MTPEDIQKRISVLAGEIWEENPSISEDVIIAFVLIRADNNGEKEVVRYLLDDLTDFIRWDNAGGKDVS